MKRMCFFATLLIAGCSTAPFADFLDWVVPGRPPQGTGPSQGGVCAPQGGLPGSNGAATPAVPGGSVIPPPPGQNGVFPPPPGQGGPLPPQPPSPNGVIPPPAPVPSPGSGSLQPPVPFPQSG